MKLNFTHGKIQHIMLFLLFFGISNHVSALDFWIKSGLTSSAGTPLAWNVAGNWTNTNSTSTTAATRVPQAGDVVNILAGKYVTIPLTATGTCDILNVIGTTANLYLEGTALLNCATININTGGNITMKAIAPSSNIITCSGTINCGTSGITTAAGKGTLTVSNGSAVSCGKLVMGAGTSTNASTIPGRTGSSTFTFTGNGSDVIPVITTGVNSTTPVFASVIFSPGVGNTITIPSGFCSLAMSIASGTVDFGNNYSTVFTGTSGSLNMEALTTLKIGGDKQIPNMATYLFNDTSTINFTGSTQIIRGILSGYKNLTLSGAGLKTLGGEVTIKLTLSIANGTILDLAGFNLTLSGNYVNGTIIEGVYTKGTGCIRSTSASDIWYRGYSNSAIQFDQTTPGTTNVVKNLTLGDISTNLGATTPSEINPLDLTIENSLNITGTVNFIAGHLISNGNVTFKSNASTTAFVGPITDLTYCGIIGDVKIERYIPATRAYRGLSSSVTGGTFFSNWQENGSVATLTGSILGNTLTTTPNLALLNKHISGANIPANTTIIDDTNALTGEYVISTSQNVASRGMIAYTSISTATIKARFTGSITANELTVTAFTAGDGLLAVGQKITGGAFPNTVITALGDGTGGVGTYTIGLEIPSETMHYNGATAGYGTHVTGLPCTDAQLGQNDSTTGLDFTRSGNPSLFTFNSGTTNFDAVTNTKTEVFTAGKPYFMLIRGDRTIDLALNITPATNTTLRSTGEILAGPLEFLGFVPSTVNFVGNPYQAPVDLSLIYADAARWIDLGSSYTVFDTKANTRGAYVTYDFDLATATIFGDTDPSTLTSAMTSILQPNQAFFVTAGATPTLVFNEADKSTADNTYVQMFRTTQNTTPKIKGSICNATTNKTLDGFILAFGDSFNNTIASEDTKKMLGNQDETFASTNDVTKMAIDKRNFPSEADEIPLSITQYRLTNYVMKFNVSNFDQMDAYLVDTYTATETTLNNNEINSYPFTVDTSIPASIAENRFKIVFRDSALQTNSNSISAFAVYPNPVVDNKFTIKSNQAFSGKDANVNIINSLGQKVFSFNGVFSTDGSLLVNPTVALSKGIYLVKVAVDGKVETKKLIIK